jgi:hypothetical protein
LAKVVKFAELCMKFVIQGRFSLKIAEPRVCLPGRRLEIQRSPVQSFVQSGAK